MHHEEIARLLSVGDDNALHSLIEAPHTILPVLEHLFRASGDGKDRAFIAEVICQHRQPLSLSFLVEAFSDPCAEVWKQALDGLVSIGTSEARLALEELLVGGIQAERVPWIEEALGQLR